MPAHHNLIAILSSLFIHSLVLIFLFASTQSNLAKKNSFKLPGVEHIIQTSLVQPPIQTKKPEPAKEKPALAKTRPTPSQEEKNVIKTLKKQRAQKHTKPAKLATKREAIKQIKQQAKKMNGKQLNQLIMIVYQQIEQHKRPLRNRLKGQAMIKFTLLQTGQVKNITILKSSGVTAIDEAALKTIQMAAPFQKLPASFTHDQPFAIPITYR